MPDVSGLPRRFRPFGARLAAGFAAAALVATIAFLWSMMTGEVQDAFTPFQRITLLGVFGAMLGVLNAVFRTSALADHKGLTVVNGYRVHRFSWPELVRVTLTPNRPWALIDLANGTTVSVMAIQVSDGKRASEAARLLATMIAEQSRTDRGD